MNVKRVSICTMCVPHISKKKGNIKKILTVVDYEWCVMGYLLLHAFIFSSLKFSMKTKLTEKN